MWSVFRVMHFEILIIFIQLKYILPKLVSGLYCSSQNKNTNRTVNFL